MEILEKTSKRRGPRSRVATLKIEKITISKSALDLLELNLYEASILDVIYQYQNAEKVVKGFCVESKKQIATDIRHTDISVLGYLRRLEEKGLIVRVQNAIQVTKKYIKALQSDQIKSKESKSGITNTEAS
jgi:DNA-binding MarR family transcriptional regulator